MNENKEREANEAFQTAKVVDMATKSDEDFATLIDKTSSSSLFSLSTKSSQESKPTEQIELDMTMKSNATLGSMATMVINEEATGTSVMTRAGQFDEQGSNQLDSLSNAFEADRVRACIQREVRELEKINDVLSGLSREEIQLRLKYLDEQMEREIDRLRLQYESKRNTILEIIEMKKKNAQIF